ncbi:GntR family transcriptional regulator [Shinella sp. 838]|jgi:DNA-binding GntR family transcriptional regulator|uniref:GntR family transcriptional regulator n=1 Tax=unclassified Shinella TaxID=2643062 RepID=UPI0003C5579A|nr:MULTISPECIES: GntR family transcriptional regulator [unclassified Shinella]EYR83961.1 GntR family transcriptional regulator [Shinella sp. DD12]MCA0344495.1 GntR family transcriptional regulator [Pseudomonadota bacterium]MDG4673199.1 GntR family transcriptional regulator [Shinella sp. 838]
MNELHRSLADKIVRHIRTSAMERGQHLTEASFQSLFGTSRQPIRSALGILADQGIVEQVPNKGFYLRDPDRIAADPLPAANDTSDEATYLRIADDRLSRRLPDRVSETDLMRRYGVSRLGLRRILTRISGEGWIERNEGRGWTFAVLIDSVEAYRECYDLRQVIEVHGIRSPEFRADPVILADLRRRQEIVADGGWQRLSQMELFEANSSFHEGLAALSGNRFLINTVQKLNQLRRLIEYRQTLNAEQVRGQNAEHLAILDALDVGDTAKAADLMHNHLGKAKLRKARAEMFSGGPAGGPDKGDDT